MADSAVSTPPMDATAMELAHRVNVAVAEYQRYFGTERTIEKLQHMIGARLEALRTLNGGAQ